METYKLILAYDGTDFRGWQRQPEERTVQGVCENALQKITTKKVAVHGAGRTDAGVHAIGQTASFRVRSTLSETDFLRALNAVLPPDVRILDLKRTEPDFHARKSAVSKIYSYRIVRTPIISPFAFRYALHWPYSLNLRAMRAGASLLVRRSDFTAFSSNREHHPVRTVLRSVIQKRGDEIIFTIEANGFLRYMVRTIVGTLLEIGAGKYPPDRIEEIFARKERALAGPTAPAKGLCLIRVLY